MAANELGPTYADAFNRLYAHAQRQQLPSRRGVLDPAPINIDHAGRVRPIALETSSQGRLNRRELRGDELPVRRPGREASGQTMDRRSRDEGFSGSEGASGGTGRNRSVAIPGFPEVGGLVAGPSGGRRVTVKEFVQGDLPALLASCLGTAAARYRSDPRLRENPGAVDVFGEGQTIPTEVARAVRDARSEVWIPESTGSLMADEENISMTVLASLAQLLHRIAESMVSSSPEMHQRASHVVREYGTWARDVMKDSIAGKKAAVSWQEAAAVLRESFRAVEHVVAAEIKLLPKPEGAGLASLLRELRESAGPKGGTPRASEARPKAPAAPGPGGGGGRRAAASEFAPVANEDQRGAMDGLMPATVEERVKFMSGRICWSYLDSSATKRVRYEPVPTLQRWGRFTLRKHPTEGLRVLGICDGMGSELLALLQAGLPVAKYWTIEVNNVSMGIVRANISRLVDTYPGLISREAFETMDTWMPPDAFAAARGAPRLFEQAADLPTLVVLTPPCVGNSRAGPGHGTSRGAGSVVPAALQILEALGQEYERRGGGAGEEAPFGWLFETAPIAEWDRRGPVAALRADLQGALGPRLHEDAARRGSTARRWTQMHTNLGSAGTWATASKAPPLAPIYTVAQLLRPGEKVQLYDSSLHGPTEWPNVEAEPMRCYPKVVRSVGSHAWRVNRYGPGKHGLGVTLLDNELEQPSVHMLERMLGFPKDWSRWSALPVRDAAGNVRGQTVFEVSEDQRAAKLGDVFDPNLATWVFMNRLAEEAHAMPVVPETALGTEPSRSPEPPMLDRGPRQGQAPPARVTPRAGEGRRGQAEVAPERGATSCESLPRDAERPAGDWDEDTPEEEFWDSLGEVLLPARKPAVRVLLRERVRATPARVPEQMEGGTPEDNKAHNQLRTALRVLVDAEEGKLPAEPQSVHLGNLPSVDEHLEFARQEVKAMAESHRVYEWHWPDGRPPTCILPLGVAVRAVDGKLRLIFDGRYINLFAPYEAFKYERMGDVLSYATVGGWAYVSDYKAGYHHIAVPELSEYLGFELDGVTYVFAMLPFGYGPACRQFTEVVTVMLQPLRERGMHMSLYIDDRLGAQATRKRCMRDMLCSYALVSALGWFLTLKKTSLVPEQQVVFLGLLVDFLLGRFVIPEAKVAMIQAQLSAAAAQAETVLRDERALASLAGRLISVRLAMPLAPLLCRNLYWAMTGRLGWNDALGSDAGEFRDLLSHVGEALVKHNGNRFWKRPGGVVFVGDAGDYGGGGGMLTGELEAPVRISYSPEQLAAVAVHAFHSTAREIYMIMASVGVILHRLTAAQVVAAGKLTYLTDSQAAYYGVMSMRAKTAEQMQWTRQIWYLCAEHDLDFRVVWAPRYTNPLVYADYMSKVHDNSQWAITDASYTEALHRLGVSAAHVVLDPFADETNARAALFYSLVLCPGTAGVNGFMQRWRGLVPPGMLAFVNGPFGALDQVLQKVAHERVDCVLIVPAWPKTWVSLLADLPVAQAVTLSRRAGPGGARVPIFQKGSRVQAGRDGVEKWSVKACLVRWPRAAGAPGGE
eukprot:jgi/Tetstr1/442063/TSEL_030242.t1